MGNTLRIALLGYVNLDITAYTSAPIRSGERLTVTKLHRTLGGMTANAACVASLLGSEVVLFSHVGDDNESDFLISELNRHEVRTGHILRDLGSNPTTCLISVYPDGDRSIISEEFGFEYTPVLRYLREDPDPESLLIHMDGYRLGDADAVVALARERGATLTVDLDGVEDHTEHARELLSSFTYVITNEAVLSVIAEGAESDWRTQALSLRSRGVKNLVVTRGAQGSAVFSDECDGVVVPGLNVETVDTTGAGDAFVGAFVNSVASEFELLTSAERANWVAARSTLGRGALGNIECPTV